MHPAELSPSTQDYLKTIWRLGEWEPERVTTTSLAARMGLAPSTVSEALKKLTAQGLVTRPAYGVVELTPEGRDVAVHMVRRHRILEMFLATELGYAWDEIHDEAEVLEHAVTDRFIDRLDAKLGHPSRTRMGMRSPLGTGWSLPPRPFRSRTSPTRSPCGSRASRTRARDLRILAEAGIRPGTVLQVLPGPARSATVRVRVAAGGTTPDGHLPGGGSPAGRQTQTSPAAAGTDAPGRDAVDLGILVAEAVWVQSSPAQAERDRPHHRSVMCCRRTAR